jgi:hypothetical protein
VIEGCGRYGLVDEREGSVVAADALDGGLEVEEAAFVDLGGDFGADAGGDGGLVADDETAGFLDGLLDGLDIVGHDGAEIDHFAAHTFLLGHLGGLRVGHRTTISRGRIMGPYPSRVMSLPSRTTSAFPSGIM